MKINIKTENAAFCDPATCEPDNYWEAAEVARIISKIQREIENGRTEGVCMDFNGNKVGEWRL